MADIPSWAPKPDWAPAGTTAPAPAPTAPPQKEGLLGLAYDTAKGLVSSVGQAIENAPAQRAAGQKQLTEDTRNAPPWYRPDLAVEQAVAKPVKSAIEETKKAYNAYMQPFTRPEDKANLTLPARAAAATGRALTGGVNLLFAPAVGAFKGTDLARDIQGVTGLSKDAAANLALIGAGAARPLAGAAAKGAEALRGAGGTARRILSPATVDDQAAATATIHRIAHGTRRAEAAREMATLDKHQKIVGNAPLADQRAIAQYVDTRSKAASTLPAKYQPAADAIRDVAQRYKARISAALATNKRAGPQFVEDYYARLWKNPPKQVAQQLGEYRERTGFGGGKQGSGRSLRARTIPTYEEGLKAGLVPVYENPLDAMKAYSDNMASFLATHDVQKAMKADGLAKYVPERAVPPGYVKLEGVNSTRDRVWVDQGGKATHRRDVLVAPESAARVYNNFISKGLDRGDVSPIYQGARKLANGMMQMKLGLSTFHGAVMGQEGVVAEVAKGLGQASRGKVLEGAKSLAKAPVAPVTTAIKGAKLRREILDPTYTSGLDPRIAKAYTEAGGRVNMERFYSTTSQSGGFFSALKRGTLGREVMDGLRDIKDSPLKGSVRLAAKTIETSAEPIFREYIPRLKAGAFASRMEAFLKENPLASQAEIQKASEKILDSVDNRFGEMIADNQFWKRSFFQVAQMLMLSPSWNLGTAREIGGGLAELPKSVKGLAKGAGISDKTAYVAALVGTNMLINGVATYLHTGEMPQGRDWLAYRTGGTDIHGKPERAQAPGYMKDVLAFAADFPNNVIPEIENKANPALTAAYQAINNKDYRGLPIVRPAHVAPRGPDDNRLLEALQFAGQQAAPISLSQKRSPGSHLTPFERVLAVREAPSYLADPERKAQLQALYGGKDWARKLRADLRAKAQQNAPPPEQPPDWAKDVQ